MAGDPALMERLDVACRATFQDVSAIPDEVVEKAPEKRGGSSRKGKKS